ncbi:hypothetical protein D9C01_13900, partial [Corynebacterium diphtheriae]
RWTDALGIRKLLTGLGRPARVAIYGGGIIAAETRAGHRSSLRWTDALGIRKLLTGLGRPARVAIYGGGIIAAET